jgi:uncharacterized membrane protein (DUF485 family)
MTMNESLPRNIASPEHRERYGSWEISQEQATVAAGAELRPDEEGRQAYEEEVRRLMIRQRRLSLLAASILFGTVFAVTISSYLFSDLLNRPIWQGFSPAILFGAVVVYPLTWLIAAVYTVVSNKMDGLG